jgi:hypothetical protein
MEGLTKASQRRQTMRACTTRRSEDEKPFGVWSVHAPERYASGTGEHSGVDAHHTLIMSQSSLHTWRSIIAVAFPATDLFCTIFRPQ